MESNLSNLGDCKRLELMSQGIRHRLTPTNFDYYCYTTYNRYSVKEGHGYNSAIRIADLYSWEQDGSSE